MSNGKRSRDYEEDKEKRDSDDDIEEKSKIKKREK